MADLEDAIRMGREAVDTIPADHPHRPIYSNDLAVNLRRRFSRLGAMADLEDAILLAREALNASPTDHPMRVTHLDNLGLSLYQRYVHSGATVDLREAQECFTDALDSPSSIVSQRIEAGRRLLSLPAILEDKDAYAIAKSIIDLIPRLTPHSLHNRDKQHLLSAVVGISSDAAAIALHANKGPKAAIELLETGRGVIAGALFEQSDITALESEYPKLARSFIALRGQLGAPASADSLSTAKRSTPAVQMEGHQRREADRSINHLLEDIRTKPGFERFLLSASEADMLEAAQHGPIVVLNVSSYRCDALIIENTGIRSGIRSQELPYLSEKAIDEQTRDPKTLETLEWLWDAIVHPVLVALGFSGPPSDAQWPHICWVPTGNLTRFPLHAAGYHLKCCGETALDRVVSTYAPSIKTIIHTRRRKPQELSAQTHKAVLVSVEEPLGQYRLEHAGDEVEAVGRICDLMKFPEIKVKPCKDILLSALKSCAIFHFAGHGVTHPSEPLESQLLLEDWKQEPFTVASLLDAKLTSNPPFLAYLSACGTSEVLDDTSVDESIHLANACQLAGFRHVIGTLWTVDDGLSVDMAKKTYEFLRAESRRVEGITDQSVSRGLHCATRALRDQWLNKEGMGRVRPRGAVLDNNSKMRSPLWAPYVHFGV
ncbi:hypothetical protein IL306_008084 [Fusarium sp. DS 682]|nr:hypothetical protein IL306_008084 [Fusarium sp. DS 682]